MNNTSLGLLIIRLSVAGLMLPHGISKIFNGVGHIEGLFQGIGLPAILAYSAYVGEVLVPILMLIGYRTRLVSLLFVFTCLVAIFLGHPNELFSSGSGGGWALELLGLYLFGSLALFFTGAGKYALSRSHKWD